ncbi:MAG: UDP-glucose/GDP-mannose dehydrogenase family protein [Candidatus Edwardsbacteria bacterium]|nr:UDP-glucose/GDP-mannose dehydrogenase family protein [Candidatus Edwardsbacteria bacterium]
MKLAVVGTGYVGLVSGVCFAEWGHQVICVDNDTAKIEMLKKGQIPIYEPGLKELMDKNIQRLEFSTSIEEATDKADIIFIAVGTPPRPNGEADLSAVETVAATVARRMKSYKLVVEKSTVPVQTGDRVKQTMAVNNLNKVEFDVASNPEFLREGTAIEDSLKPDRVVFGTDSERAKKMLLELYSPLGCPIVATDIQSSELIKHASNSFLAMKISFINAVANVCEKSGANVEQVAEGMGLDRRIGRSFLNAGIGFGGFCFPKDLQAFIRISEKLGYDFKLLKAVEEINEDQKKLFVKKIEELVWNISGKTIGMLGLAFKPNTDDMRFAPSIDIIEALQKDGAKIRAYDPVSMDRARQVLKDVHYCNDPYDAARDADCLVIVTEWEEFKELDLARIKSLLKVPAIADGRNIFDPGKMKELGFIYRGIGR